MNAEEPERLVYYLEEPDEWAEVADIKLPTPALPKELIPLRVADAQIMEVQDELYPYIDRDGVPQFESNKAVDGTVEELNEWRAAYGRLEPAQRAYRESLKEATAAYEAACVVAVEKLRLAMRDYQPTQDALAQRSSELAGVLSRHEAAAVEWEQKQQDKKEAELDALHGPRCISVTPPEQLGSHVASKRIAKVHLASCRWAYASTRWSMRANEAWELLRNPAEWRRTSWSSPQQMSVKFCGTCKPWTVFESQIDKFRNKARAELHLAEVPDEWYG